MSDATERAPSLVADRYRLDELIGSGPMGEVWRGYDTRADWVVAVKVLGATAAGAATRDVLRQHAQAVARVIHPNVAMVLDVGDHDGSPFLVMEHLTGLSLGEEPAARGTMSIVEVCDLIGQAAAGLDAAHRAGIVHGRVDPDSFRRAGSGVLKVVGFGMDDREPSERGRRYAAPERAAGEKAQASGDLYALGAVCYELLCGRPPFESPAGPETAPEPVPPSAHRPEVPAELDRLVLAMLAADPAKRPGSGESIRRALAAIARPRPNPSAVPMTGASLNPTGHGATDVHPAGPGARAGDTAIYPAGDLEPEPASSNRKLFLQVGAAAAVIAAVTVGMVMWAGARQEKPVSPTPGPSAVIATSGPRPPTTEPPVPSRESTQDPSQNLVSTLGPEDLSNPRTTAAPKATLGETAPTGGWGTWLQQFDNAVMAQQAMGGISSKVAAKASDKIRKAARKFSEGRSDPGLSQIEGIYQDLRHAQEDGEFQVTGPLAEFMDDWQLPNR
ncbi:serine/threonine protein kinase [Nonomuraea solani]|uniref:Serine/threonine protein kinase n=1 Tax=Nonomuraea solani TaxID=1144553 RepID=A0A1H6DH43_9ACTN|nr:serine/threonine-protein kinase [Nonomuraea solani]SEG83975.1 serine/threonine protein kinase [Nonomuraea solani]